MHKNKLFIKATTLLIASAVCLGSGAFASLPAFVTAATRTTETAAFKTAVNELKTAQDAKNLAASKKDDTNYDISLIETQITEKEESIDSINTACDEALDAYNSEIKSQKENVQTEIDEYNSLVLEAAALKKELDELEANLQAYRDVCDSSYYQDYQIAKKKQDDLKIELDTYNDVEEAYNTVLDVYKSSPFSDLRDYNDELINVDAEMKQYYNDYFIDAFLNIDYSSNAQEKAEFNATLNTYQSFGERIKVLRNYIDTFDTTAAESIQELKTLEIAAGIQNSDKYDVKTLNAKEQAVEESIHALDVLISDKKIDYENAQQEYTRAKNAFGTYADSNNIDIDNIESLVDDMDAIERSKAEIDADLEAIDIDSLNAKLDRLNNFVIDDAINIGDVNDADTARQLIDEYYQDTALTNLAYTYREAIVDKTNTEAEILKLKENKQTKDTEYDSLCQEYDDACESYNDLWAKYEYYERYCDICGKQLVDDDGNTVYTFTTISGDYGPLTMKVCSPSCDISENAHNYTVISETSATCTEEGEITYACTNCGDTRTESIPALGHDTFSWDTPATCTHRAYTMTRCKRCGEITDVTWYGTTTGHTFTNYVSDNNATCTTNSTETAVCDECEIATDTREVANTALGHDYNVISETDSTETTHGIITYKCSRCGDTYAEEKPFAGHVHQWTTKVVAPTCKAQGYTEYTCSCGETKKDNYTDIVDHEFSSYAGELVQPKTVGTWAHVEAVCPYCNSSKGLEYVICKYCGEKALVECENCFEIFDADEVIFPTQDTCTHNYVSSITKTATCTENGVRTYTCSRCGDTYTETIPMIDHVAGTAVKENVIAATCEKTGSYDAVVYCTKCNKELSRNKVVIAALAHNYVSSITKTATCIENGVLTHTCSRCGDTYTETIPMVDHVAGTAVKENVIAATCEKTGSYDAVVYCTKCNKELSRNKVVTEALAHKYTSTVTKAATCTENGVLTYTCGVCGNTYTETIPATGHSFTTYVSNNDATYIKDGTKTAYCDRCGVKNTITDTGSMLKMEAPTLKICSCVSTGICLTWQPVDGAVAYNIHRKAAGEETSFVRKVTGDICSYIDTDTVAGTSYTYYIVALASNNGTIYTKSNEKSATRINVPVTKIATSANDSTTLEWTATAGADKYYVYRRTSNTAWKRIATTTKLTYTDTSKLVSGETYYYLVRAVSGSTIGPVNGFGLKK